jgi:hypothetical protein
MQLPTRRCLKEKRVKRKSFEHENGKRLSEEELVEIVRLSKQIAGNTTAIIFVMRIRVYASSEG